MSSSHIKSEKKSEWTWINTHFSVLLQTLTCQDNASPQPALVSSKTRQLNQIFQTPWAKYFFLYSNKRLVWLKNKNVVYFGEEFNYSLWLNATTVMMIICLVGLLFTTFHLKHCCVPQLPAPLMFRVLVYKRLSTNVSGLKPNTCVSHNNNTDTRSK